MSAILNFDQGEFDFEAGTEDGYRGWRRRLDDQKREIESRWGIILGRRVRVQLTSFDRPVEGIIRLIAAGSAGDSGPPRLRMNSLEFSPAEIESVVRIEDQSAVSSQ